MKTLWAAEWHSKNLLDGETKHIIWSNLLPSLFRTRAECRKFIKEKYGYIAQGKYPLTYSRRLN